MRQMGGVKPFYGMPASSTSIESAGAQLETALSSSGLGRAQQAQHAHHRSGGVPLVPWSGRALVNELSKSLTGTLLVPTPWLGHTQQVQHRRAKSRSALVGPAQQALHRLGEVPLAPWSARALVNELSKSLTSTLLVPDPPQCSEHSTTESSSG